MSYQFDLSGKTVLITGASSGIGRHFSKAFARCGANVVLTARRKHQLKAVAAEICAQGGIAFWASIDVTDETAVKRAFAKAVERFGRIDVVVNNAGIASVGAALDISKDEWARVIDTNLNGAWLVAQQAGLRMSLDHKGGSIINITSILGHRVMPGVAAYIAAKAALEHLTRALAIEWGKYKIRVNAIAPGYIETAMNREYLRSPRAQETVQRLPLKRFGQVEDLEAAALLLASDASSYMTGSTIVIDGGHLQTSL